MKTQDNRDRIAAIYVRLSEEDHDKVQETDDSLSIQNQKSMLAFLQPSYYNSSRSISKE